MVHRSLKIFLCLLLFPGLLFSSEKQAQKKQVTKTNFAYVGTLFIGGFIGTLITYCLMRNKIVRTPERRKDKNRSTEKRKILRESIKRQSKKNEKLISEYYLKGKKNLARVPKANISDYADIVETENEHAILSKKPTVKASKAQKSTSIEPYETPSKE